MATVKSCPFCGGTALHRERILRGMHRVVCLECRMAGPIRADAGQAREAWNVRAVVKEVDEKQAFDIAPVTDAVQEAMK